MTPVHGNDSPQRKIPASPRIFTNTEENLLRSIERLARWTLKRDVTPEQVQKIRAATGLLRLRVEMERIMLEREKFAFEKRIEERLEVVEAALADQAGQR